MYERAHPLTDNTIPAPAFYHTKFSVVDREPRAYKYTKPQRELVLRANQIRVKTFADKT